MPVGIAMNKTDARRIAETITNKDLYNMFESAKNGIKDWTIRSRVNKSFSIGTSWNILAKDFDIEYKYHILAKKNMVWEFGDYLPDDLKIKKSDKKSDKKLPKIHHQEPIFKG